MYKSCIYYVHNVGHNYKALGLAYTCIFNLKQEYKKRHFVQLYIRNSQNIFKNKFQSEMFQAI